MAVTRFIAFACRPALLGAAFTAAGCAAAAAQGSGEARHTGAAGPIAPWLSQSLEWTIRGIEIAGIAVIVAGAIAASCTYLAALWRNHPGGESYHSFRSSLGKSILLGLEFLVAADIINTVAIDPTLESVAVLAGIVLVRTFLSFALEVEIEGRLPWRAGGK